MKLQGNQKKVHILWYNFEKSIDKIIFRIEYDAYRSDLETATLAGGVTNNNETVEEMQKQYDTHRQSYEKLKQDVSVKLKFLDENRVDIS